MEKLPAKLFQLLNVAIHSIRWNSFKAEAWNVFHYRYYKNGDCNWTLVLHPAVHEVIGGKEDGALIYPKFNISLHDVMKQFSEIHDCGIDTKDNEFWMDGMVDDLLCSFEIRNKPPTKAKVTKNYNWYTGVVQRKS